MINVPLWPFAPSIAVSRLEAVVSLLVSALKKVYVPSVVPVTFTVDALYFFKVPAASVMLMKLSGVAPPEKSVLVILLVLLSVIVLFPAVPTVHCVNETVPDALLAVMLPL